MSFFLALLTALLWGIAPIFEKVGLRGNINPLVGVTLRSFVILIVAAISLYFFRHTIATSQITLKNVVFIIIGGLIAGFFAQWSFYASLKGGSASTVVPVVAIYPIVTFILSAFFLQESVTWQKIFGILMVVGGVILIK